MMGCEAPHHCALKKMPKEITHCILAERAAHTMAASANSRKKAVGQEIYFLFEKHPELLYFGSISPDIFFYDIKLPWEFGVKHRGLVWGDVIHGTDGENTLKHVFGMLHILQSADLQQQLTPGRALTHEEKNGLTLFVLGYLTHVALDTVMHPLVYYFSGNYYAHEYRERLRAEARHRAIETVLDLYNLATIDSDLRKYRAMKKMALPKKWRDLVLSLYTLALRRAWPELTERQFGNVAAKTAREHPLFTVALRGYKKEILFNRIFQNPRLARLGLWYNKKKHDALHAHSSLLYPAQSYHEYRDLDNDNQLLSFAALKTYRDPVDDREKNVNAQHLTKKAIARSHAFFRAAWLYAQGHITEDAAARTLKGYSLNHGRLNTRTDAMRHFNPIPVNGNFELTRDTP